MVNRACREPGGRPSADCLPSSYGVAEKMSLKMLDVMWRILAD